MKNKEVFEIGDLVAYRLRAAPDTTGVVVSKRKYPKLSVRFHDGFLDFVHEDNLKILAKAQQ